MRCDIEHAIKAIEQLRDGTIEAVYIERRADTGRVIVQRIPKRIVDTGPKPIRRNIVDTHV